VTEFLLTFRLQIVGAEDGGETYLRAKSEALGHKWTLEPMLCCVFSYGR